MSLFSHYSYQQLEGTDDIKSLYKIFYSGYPPEMQPAVDAENFRPNISIDKLKRVSEDAFFLQDSTDFDSLEAVDELPLMNKEFPDRKQEFIDSEAAEFENQIDPNIKVSRAIALLWITTLLSLITAFISRKSELHVEWLTVAGLLLFSIFAVSQLSGCFSSVLFFPVLFPDYLVPLSLFYFIGIAGVFTALSFITFVVWRLLDYFSNGKQTV
jgi:hypothetical protein